MKSNIHKHTLNLREGDWDYIESIYKQRGVSTSVVVRSVISTFVDRLKASEKDPTTDLNDVVEIDL